ncbi:hypothetical protein, partial [Pseudomonas poae]|uniref:hypothetical protein n=1 Tax=Pseudomonas poae TaxID=200451 RepID=UPI0034D609E1
SRREWPLPASPLGWVKGFWGGVLVFLGLVLLKTVDRKQRRPGFGQFLKNTNHHKTKKKSRGMKQTPRTNKTGPRLVN